MLTAILVVDVGETRGDGSRASVNSADERETTEATKR